jgi:hypothetical protein
MAKILLQDKYKYQLENTSSAILEKNSTITIDSKDLQTAQKLQEKIRLLQNGDLGPLLKLPTFHAEIKEAISKGLEPDIEKYIKIMETNLASFEKKYEGVKKYLELDFQKSQIESKIIAIQDTLNSLESATDQKGISAFIKRYRESQKFMDGLNETVLDGKEVTFESQQVKALEKLKDELGNIDALLAEFGVVENKDKIVINSNETKVQTPKEDTLASLFSNKSRNKNDEFYRILYKRYSKVINKSIEENFSIANNNGELETMTNETKLNRFIKYITLNLIIKYNEKELSQIINDGKASIKFIDHIPVIIFKKGYKSGDFGGCSVKINQVVLKNRYHKSIGGIIINKSQMHGINEEIANNNDELVLKHEVVHVINFILKEKFKLTETDPFKLEALWSFIDEFLAHSTHPHDIRISTSEGVSRAMLYEAQNNVYNDIQFSKVADQWKLQIDKCIEDHSGIYRNKIKAYLISQAKNFDDIDLTIPATKAKFEKATL